MNCREAQSQLFAERDAALEPTQRAALDGHLAQCGDCKRVRDDLAAAITNWRADVNRAQVPDAEREWHAVRRRIRGGAEAAAPARRSSWKLVTWLAVPIGAAALAVAVFVSPPTAPKTQPPEQAVARAVPANSVDVAGGKATTVVFMDDKSGWLFVLASDPSPKQG
jgi:anti-sigma factor RsiW